MAKEKSGVKIVVPPTLQRNWETLDEMPFTIEQIVEIVHRWCDAQDHAKNYRQRRAAKDKMLKMRVAELAKSSGMTVEEYLEMEEANLEEGGEE